MNRTGVGVHYCAREGCQHPIGCHLILAPGEGDDAPCKMEGCKCKNFVHYSGGIYGGATVLSEFTDGRIILDPKDPFEAVLIPMVETNRKKRADYARDNDPFSNFRETAPFTVSGTPEFAAIFNCAQKLSRLLALAHNGRLENPQNEAVEDTFLDNAVYAVIALAIYKQRSAEKLQSLLEEGPPL